MVKDASGAHTLRPYATSQPSKLSYLLSCEIVGVVACGRAAGVLHA
jgi:hypothetical protein